MIGEAAKKRKASENFTKGREKGTHGFVVTSFEVVWGMLAPHFQAITGRHCH